jgi:hypothetical protein
MSSFLLLLNDLGLIRVILEYCRDNERILLSHTCGRIRRSVQNLIPSKTCFRTLTPPKILPELFDNINGVFSIPLPIADRDMNFIMYMLGQVDLGHTGVRALTWLIRVTCLKPIMDTRRTFVAKHMVEDIGGDGDVDDDDMDDGGEDHIKLSLSRRQMSVVERRMKDNRDVAMLVHDKRHWDLLKDMLFTNKSIKRFIFYSKPEDNDEHCYNDVFRFLHDRPCDTDYLDMSGPLSPETMNSFGLLASGLTGIMIRRMPNTHSLSLLESIFIRPDEAKLSCLQFESVDMDENVHNVMLDMLEVLDINRLLVQSTSLPPGTGFSNMFAVIASSCSIEKLYIRKCKLSLCEVVQCTFLPVFADSTIQELYLSGTPIPEEAAQALALCMGSKSLTTLGLNGCGLGVKCITAVVDALTQSSVSDLDLGGATLRGLAHNLFKVVGMYRRIRYLWLDECLLCKRSVKEYGNAIKEYKNKGIRLKVSLDKCRFVPRGEECLTVF